MLFCWLSLSSTTRWGDNCAVELLIAESRASVKSIVKAKVHQMEIFVNGNMKSLFSSEQACFVFQHLALAKDYNTESMRRYSWTPDTLDNVNLVSSPVHSG